MNDDSYTNSALDSYERSINISLSLFQSNEINIKNEIDKFEKIISEKKTLLENNLKSQEEIKIKKSVISAIRKEILDQRLLKMSTKSWSSIKDNICRPIHTLSTESIKPLSSDFLASIASKFPQQSCIDLSNNLWPQDFGDLS